MISFLWVTKNQIGGKNICALRFIFLAVFALFIFNPFPAKAQNKAKDVKENLLKNIIYLDLKDGRVTIMLDSHSAPKHVERIKELAKQGFYNGLTFHRVIDKFMVQTGDPTGTGTGGSHLPDLPAEFSKHESFGRGTVGAARGLDPNSANSQFFICLEAAPWLNGQYTVIGKVVAGMEHIDKIKKGDPETGTVQDPDKIIALQPAIGSKNVSDKK